MHEEIGVEREPELEPRLINPVAMTYRVFSSELSEEHALTLKAHAESGEPIKFKGQPHLVKAVTETAKLCWGSYIGSVIMQKSRLAEGLKPHEMLLAIQECYL